MHWAVRLWHPVSFRPGGVPWHSCGRATIFAGRAQFGRYGRSHGQLGAAGEKIRKPESPAASGLTAHEEHIARLARNGRTNPEIGAELFISARTVEWHLRKIYMKLGITSRVELRDALPAPAGKAPAGGL